MREETGFRLSSLRRRLKLSQAQLADVFGSDRELRECVTQETISKWERGVTKIRNPSSRQEALLDFLTDPSSWLEMQGLPTKETAIKLFPLFDPQHSALTLPEDAVFPNELEGRRDSLLPFVQEIFIPACSREKWLVFLDRVAFGYSDSPLQRVRHVELIRKEQLKSEDEVSKVLNDNMGHGLGPLMMVLYIKNGLLSLAPDFTDDENEILTKLHQMLVGELREDAVFSEEIPLEWWQDVPPAEIETFLKGLRLGMALNDSLDEAHKIGEIIKKLQERAKNRAFCRKAFNDLEQLIHFIVSSLHKNGSILITKELHENIKTTVERSEKALKMASIET